MNLTQKPHRSPRAARMAPIRRIIGAGLGVRYQWWPAGIDLVAVPVQRLKEIAAAVRRLDLVPLFAPQAEERGFVVAHASAVLAGMPPCAWSVQLRPTLFEQQFSSARIGREVLALYRRVRDNGLVAPRSIASPTAGGPMQSINLKR